jgi:hypothetical protein
MPPTPPLTLSPRLYSAVPSFFASTAHRDSKISHSFNPSHSNHALHVPRQWARASFFPLLKGWVRSNSKRYYMHHLFCSSSTRCIIDGPYRWERTAWQGLQKLTGFLKSRQKPVKLNGLNLKTTEFTVYCFKISKIDKNQQKYIKKTRSNSKFNGE